MSTNDLSENDQDDFLKKWKELLENDVGTKIKTNKEDIRRSRIPELDETWCGTTPISLSLLSMSPCPPLTTTTTVNSNTQSSKNTQAWKLHDYTIRSSSQNRTFQDEEEEVAEFCSLEERENAKRVIFQPHNDDNYKFLLTQAPGMKTHGLLTTNNEQSDEAMEGKEESTIIAPTTTSTTNNNAGWWNKDWLDDDSLFGESSSSDESEDDDQSSSSSSSVKEEEEPAEEEEEEEGEEKKDEEDDMVDDLLHQMTVSVVDDAFANSSLKSSSSSSRGVTWANTVPIPNLTERFPLLVPNPAIRYPFELDEFQKQAIVRLEQKEHVFVAAHTSAGKTVVAEYAIALAQRHCTRAVYTSPIKALSNQKYREFRTKFDNVGLITGDLQLNPDAPCLIVTTEILRSMLYRGADLIRDVEYVIFDEVHYINDVERGVVWEEVIIMLPDTVNFIFLSATTPNTVQFSDWIGRTKQRPVHVITTSHRPVPLSHYLYTGPHALHPTTQQPIHKLLDKSVFLEPGYKTAKLSLQKRISSDKPKPKAVVARGSQQSSWLQSGTKQDWTSLVKYLNRQGLIPTVIFSFSKKKCEEIAHMLRTLDLNTAVERNAAHAFTIQTIARLNPKDQVLPQVLHTCEMVRRGIGVHHGGLLPILKEMVEILFSRNLIKVLFATETFAMGVNMPARAVVFSSIRKHDGTQFRELLAGEYTQMAGRAGRRGLDTVGTVFLCCFGEEPPPLNVLRTVLTGSSTKLVSRFRLTYNMILNLLRVEDMSVEGMIKRSFSEFATQRALATKEYPKLLAKGQKTLQKLQTQWDSQDDVRYANCVADILPYFHSSRELQQLHQILLQQLFDSTGTSTCGGALTTGRILLVTLSRNKNGIVRKPALILQPPSDKYSKTKLMMIGLILLPESYQPQIAAATATTTSTGTEVKSAGQLHSISSYKNRHAIIQEISLDEILLITTLKRKIDSNELYSDNERMNSTTSTTANSLKDPFAKLKPMKSRQLDDPFSRMMPHKKKLQQDTKKTSQHAMDQAISFLLEAESMEPTATLTSMDLRDCSSKGVSSSPEESLKFRSDCERIDDMMNTLREYQSHRHPNLEKHYAEVEKMETLKSTVHALQHLLSNESLNLFPDFLQRKALLQSLGYVDHHDTVCVKGRVACELSTCGEELIATEMVFEGIFNDLEPAEIAAVLSAFVFQEKTNREEGDPLASKELPDRLRETCLKMKDIGLRLEQLQKEHGIEVGDYCEDSLKFGLVHVVYEWALGVPFSTICQLTTVQEGSIVRCITRLDELCREVRNCSRVVGNPTLYRKMEAASVAIKRDIVFAASLYIT